MQQSTVNNVQKPRSHALKSITLFEEGMNIIYFFKPALH